MNQLYIFIVPGFDDDRGDYTIVERDHIAYRFEILGILGKGSFGQVVKCRDHKCKVLRAIKLIRNKKRFHQQALVEVRILHHLRKKVRFCSNHLYQIKLADYIFSEHKRMKPNQVRLQH